MATGAGSSAQAELRILNVARLVELGVTPPLAAKYAKHGWIMRLGQPPGSLPRRVSPRDLRSRPPKRAAMGMLYEAGTNQGMEEARHLFERRRNPRKHVTCRLLASCTSVEAVRSS